MEDDPHLLFVRVFDECHYGVQKGSWHDALLNVSPLKDKMPICSKMWEDVLSPIYIALTRSCSYFRISIANDDSAAMLT